MNKDQQTVDENELNKHGTENNMQPELTGEPDDVVSKLEETLALEKDKYLRLLAEFDNYKRRSQKERLDLLRTAGSEMIVSILPVLDDFERAGHASPLPEGVVLIYTKLLNTLTQKGLKPMDAKGKDFDADLHDAITNIPVADVVLKNKVVDELEKGYFLNDKVIRHAKVIVGN